MDFQQHVEGLRRQIVGIREVIERRIQPAIVVLLLMGTAFTAWIQAAREMSDKGPRIPFPAALIVIPSGVVFIHSLIALYWLGSDARRLGMSMSEVQAHPRFERIVRTGASALVVFVVVMAAAAISMTSAQVKP